MFVVFAAAVLEPPEPPTEALSPPPVDDDDEFTTGMEASLMAEALLPLLMLLWSVAEARDGGELDIVFVVGAERECVEAGLVVFFERHTHL